MYCYAGILTGKINHIQLIIWMTMFSSILAIYKETYSTFPPYMIQAYSSMSFIIQIQLITETETQLVSVTEHVVICISEGLIMSVMPCTELQLTNSHRHSNTAWQCWDPFNTWQGILGIASHQQSQTFKYSLTVLGSFQHLTGDSGNR